MNHRTDIAFYFAKTRKLPALILIAAWFASCQGFLDIEPQDEISNEEALDDLRGIEAAVIGMYNGLTQTEHYRQFFPVYPELAGNLQPSPNAVSNGDIAGSENIQIVTFRDLYAFNTLPQYANSSAGNLYSEVYHTVNRANNIINALPDLEQGTEAQRNSLLGEALAVRALCHFDLLRVYGQHYTFTPDGRHPGIVVLERTPSVFVYPARNSVAEGYERIKSDLLAAIDLIGPAARRNNRNIWLSPHAARALLARVYAYREEWEEVVRLSTEVIESGLYPLVPTGNYVAAWIAGQLSETIFEVDLQGLVREDGGGVIASPGSLFGAGLSEPVCNVTQDLLGLYPAGDIRLGLFQSNGQGDMLSLKYPFVANEVNNIPVIRLSEMYLLRAEAQAELGNEAAARADYDVIHRRANPTAAPLTISGEALREEIFAERRRELALEGHLLYDLARKRKNVERQECLDFNPNCTLTYPDYRYVLPIPQEAIDANPSLLQNEGY